MKFFYNKKPKTCRWCHGDILRGDLCIRIYIHNVDTGYKGSIIYHFDCYIPAIKEGIDNKAIQWANTHDKPKKLGRPRKYSNQKEAHKIIQLIRYHRARGNSGKVEELGEKLSLLSVGTLTNK